jgi:hypothetical protein
LLTPATLVAAPAVGYIAALINLGVVLDCSGGVYTDPDGVFKGLSVGYPGVVDGAGARVAAQEYANFDIDDDSLGNIGVGVYPGLITHFVAGNAGGNPGCTQGSAEFWFHFAGRP